MKPGYKQTEIGLIPEEWELFTIGELGDGNRPAVKAGPFGSALKRTAMLQLALRCTVKSR